MLSVSVPSRPREADWDTMAEDCEPQVSAVVHTHTASEEACHKTAQCLAFPDGMKMTPSLPAEDILELVKYDFLKRKSKTGLLFTEKL